MSDLVAVTIVVVAVQAVSLLLQRRWLRQHVRESARAILDEPLPTMIEPARAWRKRCAAWPQSRRQTQR